MPRPNFELLLCLAAYSVLLLSALAFSSFGSEAADDLPVAVGNGALRVARLMILMTSAIT